MQDPTRLIQNNRLRCKFEKNNTVLSFSLVDYRNKLFTSNEPEKILEFYNGFDNRDQLIQWMKERPKGVSYIHEVEGDKDIIVVIPTADFNGKYAINCKENIFKGLHMIFVESGGKDDFYFNYAHNCNVGIKKAMEYNPKWVVVSNDDMYKIDETYFLKECLNKVDNEENILVNYSPSEGISRIAALTEGNLLRKIYYSRLITRMRGKQFLTYGILDLETKLKTRYFPIDLGIFSHKLFHRRKLLMKFIPFSTFVILSGKYIKEMAGELFDETYINDSEDVDLAIRLSVETRINIVYIDYKIGSYIGSTLSGGACRWLRSFAGISYLNYKIEMGQYLGVVGVF